MEIQDQYLQLSCFEFFDIRASSRSKSARKRTKIFWNAKYGILNRFDTLSYFDHNSLIRNPIDWIQIDMEITEEYLQLSCFEFFKIRVLSRLKVAHKRIKFF